MRRTLIVMFLVCLAAATAAQAQYVCGNAWKLENGPPGYGHGVPAANFHMKFCPADPNTGQPQLGSCTFINVDYAGNYSGTLAMGGNGPFYWFPYLWRDEEAWGSSTYPVGTAGYYPFNPGVGCSVPNGYNAVPRALPSAAVNPPNGVHDFGVGGFWLKWTDGLDSTRTSPFWPVTYDVWSSGNEYPDNRVLNNVSCNYGVDGYCSAYISGLQYTTRYRWKIVGKIADATYEYPVPLDQQFWTTSLYQTFSTTWNPSIPVYNILTNNGSYLKAANGGGSSFDATGGTSSNWETQFQFVDKTTGTNTIYSGDQVNIHTNRNYFASATNGGGSDMNAVPAWNQTYETFTIIRIAGPGRIWPGDQVAFQSYYGYYMSADVGGGAGVTCDRTAIGPWETFTFQ